MLTKKIYGGGKQNSECGKDDCPPSMICQLHSVVLWRLPRQTSLLLVTLAGQASLPLATLRDLTILSTKNHTFEKQIENFE
jgi:hypothetical protein